MSDTLGLHTHTHKEENSFYFLLHSNSLMSLCSLLSLRCSIYPSSLQFVCRNTQNNLNGCHEKVKKISLLKFLFSTSVNGTFRPSLEVDISLFFPCGISRGFMMNKEKERWNKKKRNWPAEPLFQRGEIVWFDGSCVLSPAASAGFNICSCHTQRGCAGHCGT